jgi:hypothetical protein
MKKKNPDGSFSEVTLDKTKSVEEIKKSRSMWSIFSPSPAIQRLVIPGELLRIIIRDVTILSIFFTILQSEFDLMVREYDAIQKKNLLSVLSADSSLSQPVKDAFQKFLNEDSWLQSDEYIKFKCNLPFNNLDIIQTADQAIIGAVGFEGPAALPSVEEIYGSKSNSNGTNTPQSGASNPSGVNTPKGGRRSQSKRTSVFALKGISMSNSAESLLQPSV